VLLVIQMYTLVDVNNIYVSCERSFNQRLDGSLCFALSFCAERRLQGDDFDGSNVGSGSIAGRHERQLTGI
jgi:hypothetical protein